VQTFQVVFQFDPDGGWWGRCSPGDVECRARTLAASRLRARRMLAESLGCEEAEVVLSESFDLPGGINDLLARTRAARQRADEERRRSVETTREAVSRLSAEVPQLGMRDIAALVGVSYQRVQQLLSGR
jgi:hypothetical protein